MTLIGKITLISSGPIPKKNILNVFFLAMDLEELAAPSKKPFFVRNNVNLHCLHKRFRVSYLNTWIELSLGD